MFQLCSAFLGFQTIIFSILIPTNLVLAEEERPKSALKWITVSEAEKLPNGFCNEDLVRFGEGPCIVGEAAPEPSFSSIIMAPIIMVR